VDKDIEIIVSEVETISLEMEILIDSLLATIEKLSRYMLKNRKDDLLLEELRKSKILNRVQAKINTLSELC